MGTQRGRLSVEMAEQKERRWVPETNLVGRRIKARSNYKAGFPIEQDNSMCNKIDTWLSVLLAMAPDVLAAIQQKPQVKELHRKHYSYSTGASPLVLFPNLPTANTMHK